MPDRRLDIQAIMTGIGRRDHEKAHTVEPERLGFTEADLRRLYLRDTDLEKAFFWTANLQQINARAPISTRLI